MRTCKGRSYPLLVKTRDNCTIKVEIFKYFFDFFVQFYTRKYKEAAEHKILLFKKISIIIRRRCSAWDYQQ